MVLTKYGIKSVGFKEYPEDDILNVKFRMVEIFTVDGLLLEGEEMTTQSISYDNNCRAMIGNNLKTTFKKLLNTKVDDDYFSKLSEHRLFLVIDYFSEKMYSTKGGHRIESAETISTYKQFKEAKRDIANIKDESSRSIVVAVQTQLAKIFHEINITFRDCIFFGKNTDGKTVIDLEINSSLSATCLMRVGDIEKINSLLNLSKEKKDRIENLGIENYYNGQQEKDDDKKFMFYFAFIEKFTQKNFKKHKNIEIKEKNDIGYYKKELLNHEGIRERFIFCSLYVWNDMEKKDIDDFLELKNIRNDLAHGRNPEITLKLITKIEILSLKIIS